jgi:hypothetical protein
MRDKKKDKNSEELGEAIERDERRCQRGDIS